jgi:hypothetical protein
MNKETFRSYFRQALARSIADSQEENILPGLQLERFEVHAPGPKGQILPEAETINAIFLGETLFYRIIDVGLIIEPISGSIGFVRVSGHAPSRYEDTFDPQDLGPFRSIGASITRK